MKRHLATRLATKSSIVEEPLVLLEESEDLLVAFEDGEVVRELGAELVAADLRCGRSRRNENDKGANARY